MKPEIRTSKDDRRAEQRLKIDLFINRFVNGYPYLCLATDISRTGMRVVPLHEPAGGPKYMGLQFQLPGTSDVITAAGEAVTATAEGEPVGVRFTRLPNDAAALIARYVAQAA